MFVNILANGPHEKGGDEAHNYDGPLTTAGREILGNVPLLPFDRAISGQQERHIQTAELVMPRDMTYETDPRVGNDEIMISALATGDEDQVITGFRDIIGDLKAVGHERVMFVTSRAYSLLMAWLRAGGQNVLGKFVPFWQRVDELHKAGTLIMPCYRQGRLSIFEC